MTIEKRIKKEYDRIKKLYAELPANRLQLVTPLIQNAAFLKITLDDLQIAINQQGCVDLYQNGANQSGRHASAEITAYNNTLKNYQNTIDRLDKMLPAEKRKSKLDALVNA
nr:MAG TPA: hypothetical protein [Caudoviricetes sp.]